MDAFYSEAKQKADVVNLQLSTIVQNVTEGSELISALFTSETAQYHERISKVDLSDEKYHDAHLAVTEVVLTLLDQSDVDSAFLYLIDDTENHHFSVKVIDVNFNTSLITRGSYELLVGSSSLSSYYGLTINEDWELYPSENDLLADHIQQPIWAVSEYPYGELEQYGYWEIPSEDDECSNIFYSVPLLDELGQVYGVVGVEISEDYFIEKYVNLDQFSYQNSFHVLGDIVDGTLVFHEGLPNSSFAKLYLSDGLAMKIESTLDYQLYATTIDIIGKVIAKTTTLNLYSNNSPFLSEQLCFLTFVPEKELYSYSSDIKSLFVVCFSATFVLSLFVIGLILHLSTRKIVALSAYIKDLSPRDDLHFIKTNLKEIDELTNAVELLNRRVLQSTKITSRMIEMTELNLGGFEVDTTGTQVIVTEYPCRLLQISHTNRIPRKQWDHYYAELTQQVMDMERNIYLYQANDETIYLKILKTSLPTGDVGVILDVTKEIEETIAVKNQINYDSLTKLYSRLAFHQNANNILHDHPDCLASVIFIDLDNLKYINDTYGHDYGDLYITTASTGFKAFSEHRGFAARMSGDEFAIFLYGYQSKDEMRKVIDETIEHCKGYTIDLPDGSIQKIRFSSGVSWYPSDATDVDQLVKFADFAMYEVKHDLKGSLIEFDRKVYDEKLHLMENREIINKLIEERQIYFVFQPIVDLKTGEIYGYEALMRSKLPDFKSPLEILRVAEAQYKLNELENMIMPLVIKETYNRRDELADARIFINSITSQLISMQSYSEITHKYGDFLNRFVVELTASEDRTHEQTMHKLSLIRKCSMKIALDDFGKAYCNEMRILDMNPDIIKIDMSLLQGIATDKDKQLLCNNIITYSHSKNTTLVAEGIEEYEDMKQLMHMGVDYIQGFYIAKPSPNFQPIDPIIKSQIQDINQHIQSNR